MDQGHSAGPTAAPPLTKITCPNCKGQGKIHRFETCSRCHGEGEVGPWERVGGPGDDHFYGNPCPECSDPNPDGVRCSRGQVYLGQMTCGTCNGQGHYWLDAEKPPAA